MDTLKNLLRETLPQDLERERAAEYDAERERRIAIYAAWCAKYGRLGDDLPGILSGRAKPPPPVRDQAKGGINHLQCSMKPCTVCGTRVTADPSGKCYPCKQPHAHCQRCERRIRRGELCFGCRMGLYPVTCGACGTRRRSRDCHGWRKVGDEMMCVVCLRPQQGVSA